jgi:hypothetical protein
VRHIRILAALGAVALITLATPAAAQSYADIKGMDERFSLNLGGFFQDFTTTLRLDSATLGNGTTIDFEGDLGADSHKTSFRADGYWRFGRHGRFDFGFLSFSRSNSKSISRDIQFGDHVYHAGATLSTEMRVTEVDMYYAYSFLNTGEAEVGAKIGISAMFHSASIEGTGNITGPNGSTSGGFAADDKSFVAPIPAVGIYVRYTLLPGLLIGGQVRGLPTVTISGYSGSMVDAGGYMEWYPWKNFGIGGGYQYTKITAGRESSPSVELDYTYSGVIAYASVKF